jgi:Ca2+-binding RTX toxin-like protein
MADFGLSERKGGRAVRPVVSRAATALGLAIAVTIGWWATAASAQVDDWSPVGDIETLPNAFGEASASTRSIDGRMWTVDDSEITIHSWRETAGGWVGVEEADLSGTVFDAEGITTIGLRSDRFAVLDERNGGLSRIVMVNLSREDLGLQTITLSDVVVSGGDGAEALTYSLDESTFSNMVFYVGVEKTRSLRRYEIAVDSATGVVPASELTQTATNSWTLTGINEIAGLADDPNGDTIYIVDEAGGRIASVQIGQTATTVLADTDDIDGTPMDQPEGIFFNDCLGQIDIVGENNASSTSSQYLRFTRSQTHTCGDVLCDGLVNIVDALAIAQYSVGNRGSSDTCPADNTGSILLRAADTSVNGDVNIADALLIAQCSVGIPRIPCPDPTIPDALANMSEEDRMDLANECLAGGVNLLCPPAATCRGLDVTVNLTVGQTPTAGPDVILGTDGNDEILALGGDDVICAGDGDDVVVGGPGNDVVIGGPGNDTISGGDGADIVAGNSGDDDIDGGPGADRLFAGSGNDVVEGGNGNDLVGGGSGVDVVTGGNGNDRVAGGSDNDSAVNGGPGADTVNGGSGNDGNVTGDDGDDEVSGNGGNDVVNGNAGDDVVRGGSGDDIVKGDAGDDFVAGNGGVDVCDGGSGGETTGDTAAANCEATLNIP